MSTAVYSATVATCIKCRFPLQQAYLQICQDRCNFRRESCSYNFYFSHAWLNFPTGNWLLRRFPNKKLLQHGYMDSTCNFVISLSGTKNTDLCLVESYPDIKRPLVLLTSATIPPPQFPPHDRKLGKCNPARKPPPPSQRGKSEVPGGGRQKELENRSAD